LPKKETVDVIVVTFSRRLYLEQTLESIVKNTQWPYRLIVIDNASKDDTQAWLKANEKRLKIHKLLLRSHNVGVAAARMIGIGQAKSSIVACSDDDAWYNPGWLTECMRMMKVYPEIAVATVDKHPGRAKPSAYLGKETRHGVSVIFRQCRRPYSMVFRKDAIVHVGGFRLPKNHVMGFMNAGLCNRLRHKGWKVGRSDKRWKNPATGQMERLVIHMDVLGGKRSHREHYDKTGYTVFRSQAKRGKVREFDPRVK